MQQGLLSLADELFTHSHGVLECFMLQIFLASIEKFLVRIDLCFQLALSDQLSQLLLNDFERNSEVSCNFVHVNNFVRLYILQQRLCSNRLENST